MFLGFGGKIPELFAISINLWPWYYFESHETLFQYKALSLSWAEIWQYWHCKDVLVLNVVLIYISLCQCGPYIWYWILSLLTQHIVQILKCGHLCVSFLCSFSGGDMNINQGITPRISAKVHSGPKVLGLGLDLSWSRHFNLNPSPYKGFRRFSLDPQILIIFCVQCIK